MNVKNYGAQELTEDLKNIINNISIELKNILEHPELCPHCKEKLPKRKKFCNKSCTNNFLKTKVGKEYKLYKMILKTGVRSPGNTPESIAKRKQTNLLRYGTENPNELDYIKNKIKEINEQKYGVKSALCLKEVREKGKETYFSKNGVRTPFELNEIQTKIKDINIEKYGTEFPTKTETIKNKIKQTCLEKYGTHNASLKHIKNYEHLNREYFNTFITNDGYFDMEKCIEHFGFNYSCALNYKKKFGIEAPNKVQLYKTQRFIFDSIKVENKLLNDRNVLNGIELDIYLPSNKLAIEYNGLLFHSRGISKHPMFNNPARNAKYHLNKTLWCESRGIQLFHIFEGEDIDLWLSMINNKLNLNEKVFARDCYIKELKSADIVSFLNENHIQGFVNSKINLGLFTKNESKMVSVMTFSKPRFNKKYEYELIRFCSLKNTTIVGGASKLFKHFIRVYNPKTIISYANRRFSKGEIYKTLGFSLINVSKPNYFYFKFDSLKLESRTKFQKHRLKKLFSECKLDYFNENETERINMFKNGYREIFDCGNLVFEWIRK